MGWFKKKAIDAPPLLDVPEPIDISNDPIKELGEIDIPPITLSNREENKEMELKLPEEEVDVPLPPPDMDNKGNMDLPPMPQPSADDSDQGLLFPSMEEPTDSQKPYLEESQGEEVTSLPFEHAGDYPSEQELSETFAVPKPRHQAHHIPNYDALLEQAKAAAPRMKPNKKYFISLTEYKEVLGEANAINGLCGNEIDTVLRIKNIQDEKSARYERYQHELEQINNLFGRLDNLIFTTEKIER